jgi:hypothetical protein
MAGLAFVHFKKMPGQSETARKIAGPWVKRLRLGGEYTPRHLPPLAFSSIVVFIFCTSFEKARPGFRRSG